MSENDGKIHTVYMRDPLKIKSQNLPYKKTDLYGRISRGFPGPCRGLVLVEGFLLSPLNSKTLRRRRRGAHVGAGPVDARSDVARDAGETVVLPYAIQANWTFWVCHTKWVKKGGV